jgi:cysteine synthase
MKLLKFPWLVDLIGNTPLFEVNLGHKNPDVKIFAKLELINPGGSIKKGQGCPVYDRAD